MMRDAYASGDSSSSDNVTRPPRHKEGGSTNDDRRHVQATLDHVAHVTRHLVVHDAVFTEGGEGPHGRPRGH